MKLFRTIAALAASAALITACGGGGGKTSAPALNTPQSSNDTGKITLAAAFGAVSVAVSGKRRAPASGTRRPSFITPGLQTLAIYDSTTLVYVANVDLTATSQFTTVYMNPDTRYGVTPGGCTNNASTETCQVTIQAKPGDHFFDLIAYPGPQTASSDGSPPSFIGVISSEGEIFTTIHPHETLTGSVVMLGVASLANLSGPDSAAYNETVQFSYEVLDSTPLQIVTPGAYDNGPVTIAVSQDALATVTPPTSFASPASSPGTQTFSVTCTNPNGGAVGVSLQANAQPNRPYASALNYSGGNYSSGTLASAVLDCGSTPATLPITIQSHKRSQ